MKVVTFNIDNDINGGPIPLYSPFRPSLCITPFNVETKPFVEDPVCILVLAKSSGKLSLTEQGLEFIDQNGGVQMKITPPTMEENQEKLKQSILDNAKAPAHAVDAVWDLLMDGQGHEATELLEVAGYKRPDSTGYRELVKWLKKLELVEKQGKSFSFTDKVYRYGSRPSV